ncbi:hypothetical protein VE01_05379 [Pseudogymnoascus verrucosus]|uniref:Uncharacterized protein n=1 Tax=Pseudogymnoascus verrucosus TaxID=342668 RepID=A0A1B8GL40_9PEZI|nr:uncharacterized protein VE01_05379 [Pseudogymnoascus verrucosus]OBT46357.1 hypothetical protein VE00_02712 [Pseudogymnoascus sp. WSF 3629]OBT96506.1 hypothetical protein VE01_05379 [Pseudogymnoascus verrucosus]
MQFTSILFLAIQATGVLSASYAGNTGVAPDLSNSSMPPPGTAWARSSDKFNPLTARGCVSTAPFGCDLGKGRCWKVCGDGGQWCWTAGGDGSGDWNTCSDWGQCNQQQSCGKNCHNAAECGCSC